MDNILIEHKEVLSHISREIWSNPEENYEEVKAHQVLTESLDKLGFLVTPSFCYPTGFKATFSNYTSGSFQQHVCVICEYDALPSIGHACGHNLIAVCGVAVGLLIKNFLANHTTPVLLTVLGTPAEEGGGGKVKFIEDGFFKDVDVCVMAHPAPINCVFAPFLAINDVVFKFGGKEAHASGAPWEGVNALDAAVACYTNVSNLRQQFKPDWRVHGVITKGGVKPNIIPAETELFYYIRCQDQNDLEAVNEKIYNCARAAAMATGCSLKMEKIMTPYKAVVNNPELGSILEDEMNKVGLTIKDKNPSPLGSTDMGNVSQEVPSLHPIYHIGTAINHTPEFTRYAGSEFGFDQTMLMAKAMASTLIQFLTDKNVELKTRKDFDEWKANCK